MCVFDHFVILALKGLTSQRIFRLASPHKVLSFRMSGFDLCTPHIEASFYRVH